METSVDLHKIRVRLVSMGERHKWRDLMDRYHYLGFRGTGGEQLWYVVEVECGKWIALIGWCTGVYRCSPRDQRIGWESHVRMSRLKYVANNFRFLILPDIRVKNLASRVLSLNLKRLSHDWQQFYGHGILWVETFVQEPYRGTCYLAANWQEIGRTRGFGRHNGRYYYHGNEKRIFILSLSKHASGKLSDPQQKLDHTEEKVMHINWKQVVLHHKESLLSTLREVPDFRDIRGKRHSLVTILAISVGAMCCGAKGFRGIHDWAMKLSRYDLKRLGSWHKTAPGLTTLKRVFAGMDAEKFDQLIYKWLSTIRFKDAEAISFDGKTLRGSHDGEKKAIHLMSALLMNEKVTISQANVGDKTNEIPVLQEMIKHMDIAGKTITADAMHTQAETARVIVQDKKANYVFTVKDNQKKLHETLKSLDSEAFPP